MTIHDNQPVQFNTPESQGCDTIPYSQLVNETDVTQVQFELEPCQDAINLAVNGSFADTLLYGWDNISGKWNGLDHAACYNGNGTGELTQDVLAPNTYYRIELEVLSIENQGYIEVQFGVITTGFITTVGKHTLYGWTDDTNTLLTIKGLAVSGAGIATICVDDINVFEVDLNLLVAVLDKDDNQVLTRYLPDFITVVDAGLFDFNKIDGDEFNLTGKYLTMFFDWTAEGLSHGCYHFAIADNCINTNGQMRVPNGEFSEPSFQLFGIPFPTLQPWELTQNLTGNIVINNGIIKYTGLAPIDGGFATQTMLQIGNTYEYEIKVNTIDIGVFAQVLYGGVAIPLNVIGVISGSIVATGVDLQISAVGVGDIEIEYIRHRVPDNELFFDHDGVGMSLGEYDNTLLVNACNDSNSFNFGFEGTGFSPTVRIESKLVNAQFPSDRRVERDSNGKSRVTFFDRKKNRTLKVEYQPEYIHDFLSLLGGFDHFYIDLVEFSVAPDEEYFIEYGDQDTIGTVTFDVVLKEQIMRNAACKAEGVGCALPPNFLEQETGDLVLGENGEFILITG